MEDLHDVETSLLDDEDVCRDVNFEEPTWEGVAVMVAYLGGCFLRGDVSDAAGRPVTRRYPESLLELARSGGCASLQEGRPPITALRVFVEREETGVPFVELTFFPDEVAVVQDLRNEFLAWAEGLRARLQARRHYARYEDASWTLGDTGPTSGVFLASAWFEREA